MAKEKKTDQTVNPILQFAVLCDGVTAPDQRGKVAFVGVFDNFLRPTLVPHFTLALGWKGGKGKFTHKIRFLDPDLTQMFESPKMEFELKHESQGARSIINFDGLSFSKPGVYWIEIFLGDNSIMSIPLPVLEEG